MQINLEKLDPKKYILIKNAHIHNLKNVDVAIPRNKLVVITGLSGSGKSSLAFDTLYAEGQRRYVESLSSYARQFLGRMDKPDVEYIKGISPAIAIEQKVISRNPRSTVGTSTEIYEYLKLLFARVGKTYSPISGKVVKRHAVADVIDKTLSWAEGSKLMISAPAEVPEGRDFYDQLKIMLQQGYTRVGLDGRVENISTVIEIDGLEKNSLVHVIIDRLVVKHNNEFESRLADSVQTAFFEGKGICHLHQMSPEGEIIHEFSNKFELDGITFEEPSLNLFTFNNPYGACKRCDGFGTIIGIDPDLVIPDKSLSVYESAIACWKGEKMSEWKNQLLMNAHHFDFPVHKPISELSKKEHSLLWSGNKYFAGLNEFFKEVEEQAYKIQYRVMLSRYRGKTECPECEGTRLRHDANYVKIDEKSISDLVKLQLIDLKVFFDKIELNDHDLQLGSRILIEIKRRLKFLIDVGLGYLSLNRLAGSLSGGESQRINLATSLGSNLVGSIYILDEPSIGLHSRDTSRLIKVLKDLRDLGNTVVVVEHDEEIIRTADHIIDLGPKAGYLGGELVFSGNMEELQKEEKGLTAHYIQRKMKVASLEYTRKWRDYIEITHAVENNLKNVTVKFPLNNYTVVTGVSGSGKTSLVKGILYPALKKHFGGYAQKTGNFGQLKGDYDRISDVEMIDQNPIGRSSRSNPATYVKAWDDVRQLFSKEKLSTMRGYKPGYFSFNIPGGRCETCEGEGTVKIEMQFMADISLVCEECKGMRFKDEVLDVQVGGKNVFEILDMTINQALEFFTEHQGQYKLMTSIINKLKPLQDVGLGYLKMGQASSTLSGGEAQRIKLAYYLSKGQNIDPILFIFDEPTTGLHFHDIDNLLKAFYALIDQGHSLIVIEHNLDMVKNADWIIDLGPEGGDKGGEIVFAGLPEDLLKSDTHTAQSLKIHLEL
ncbi:MULTISPECIES: excinuclease ABC subunit UvrA [unclassified Lentimicrobium]|uniref:excinuclease ABC subunit UvrA n=1 Tax=unclassified Lentimicrobium TaxID=2677434 RepID=UPI001551D011|nr:MULTISPECIES: excinuclease ABC subunit UvrA [unclassified Lentimicrobium]NPD46874.1 excinuclease ABC subunit UvrA [Lentimicrobium sp. S6]NPD84457.1 excinuclease ABC subunit UvrA [Lentimicrobium sp. L6]